VIGVHHYLAVSALLFAVGLYGILTRRSILMILLAVELLPNAANLAFVAFARHAGELEGQAVVFFTMIVAAAEVTVGLAIVLLAYRKKGTTRADALRDLRW
jgi:NADH-quinone oxidoreductase subunit K